MVNPKIALDRPSQDEEYWGIARWDVSERLMMTQAVTTLSDLVPFSPPFRSRKESQNLVKVLSSGQLHGDGPFTASAARKISALSGAPGVLLTTSATHSLEMAVALLGIGVGDEVIVPSFTFPSAADAVARTGATCVFVDIDSRTGNLDPHQVREAVGSRTKAISIMHYCGVPVDIDAIETIAAEYGLPIIEDNAHGLGTVTGDRVLGSIGVFAAQSFHGTKNVQCGEGGALLINDPTFLERAEIMREKGTNRSQFLRGQVDKYSWVDWGSSYLPSELTAAVLDSQLDYFGLIQSCRFSIWDHYARELGEWAASNRVELMEPPFGIHAAHLFYLLLPTWDAQGELITHLRAAGVVATFHYVSLDTSLAGRRFGRSVRPLSKSENFSRRLVRLPLWAGMTEDQLTRVVGRCDLSGFCSVYL